jgi:uncharacterized repeat protein (TIGR01451 family)
MKFICKMSDLIRKSCLMAGVGLLLTASAVFSGQVTPGMKNLHDNMPAIVAHLSPKGNLSALAELKLAIGLPLQNAEALTNLLQQIYDPASTNYHHYLTPEQFTAQFSPTPQDYEAVKNFAKANGLAITGEHPNRIVLDVSGKAGAINKAFQVSLRTYHHPTENRDFFAPDVDPTVPATLPILHISGLNNYFIPHPNYKQRPVNKTVQTSGAVSKINVSSVTETVPAAGSGPGGTYQGSDFRNAYVPGTSLNGSGQNVGLLQFDGFYASDIAAYASQIGLTNVPNLVVVPIDGGVPVPTPIGNPEVSLDIEMVLSMSPGVSNIYVYEAPNPSPWVDLLNRMANDNLAKQLSCSWGGGPPNPTAEQIFQQMALQGQTFFNAVGDSCAFTTASNPVSFPADSPHITEVGGTTLTTGAGKAYQSETVWNWGIEFGSGADGIGSCGGISPNYTIPSWQTNINMSARGGSATMRNMPDVALTADNVYVIYGSGQTGSFGGTSCAAPLWGGFTALINQQAMINGHAPVGFLNPALYNIANSAAYTNCFHDTATGNNTWSGSPNLFYATNNYDLCTGIGTPNGTNLINALTAAGVTNPVIQISPPPAPYGSTLATLIGGNPNGTWYLFVQDDTKLDAGSISNGWSLALTTANPVGFSANLQLLMSASSSNVMFGGTVVYTIAVTNYGPSTSSNVVVADTLPLGGTLVSSSQSQGSVIRSGNQVLWNVTNLLNGAGAQLTLTVQLNSGGLLINYAIATATTPDPNSDDNSTYIYVTSLVPAPAVLSGASVINGIFNLTVAGTPGLNYTVQASTNLVNWTSIYTTNSPFTFTDPNASNYPTRFYRTVSGP